MYSERCWFSAARGWVCGTGTRVANVRVRGQGREGLTFLMRRGEAHGVRPTTQLPAARSEDGHDEAAPGLPGGRPCLTYRLDPQESCPLHTPPQWAPEGRSYHATARLRHGFSMEFIKDEGMGADAECGWAGLHRPSSHRSDGEVDAPGDQVPIMKGKPTRKSRQDRGAAVAMGMEASENRCFPRPTTGSRLCHCVNKAKVRDQPWGDWTDI
ncbi:hypothetical protein CB1_001366003 [Camelus ferus]|nr:hypothetical protein CB1_001366003 [Camelus ferus]